MKRETKLKLEGITFEGAPVAKVVEQVERKEIEGEFKEEANKYRKSFTRRGGRVKMDTSVKESPAPLKTYSDEEKFGLLVAKGGGIPVEEYLRLPEDTRRKVYKLHKGLLMIPDKFLTSEVQDLIVKDVGMTDYQRFLFMLFQGGYLRRDKDVGHRVIHVKTDAAKSLSSEMLAADIVAKNGLMTGFPVKRKPRKLIARKNWAKEPEIETKPEAGQERGEDAPQRREESMQQGMVITKFSQPLLKVEPGSELSGSLDPRVQGLEEGDIRMIFDLIEVLKVTRQYLPKLKRKEFLATFASGSKYVEE